MLVNGYENNQLAMINFISGKKVANNQLHTNDCMWINLIM